MAGKVNLGMAGGVLAFGGGLLQTLFGALMTTFAQVLHGDLEVGVGLIAAGVVSVIVGAFLISGAKSKTLCIVLIVSALLCAFVGGTVLFLSASLGLIGGTVALFDHKTVFGGMTATLKRIAEAAKKPGASDPSGASGKVD